MQTTTAPLRDHAGSLHQSPRAASDRDGLNERSIAYGTNACDRFKFEWKWENLWFSGEYPHTYGRLNWVKAFGTSGSGCWCCSRARGTYENLTPNTVQPPWLWLAWRVVVCAYLTAVCITAMVLDWGGGTWFWYLTNWQQMVFMLYGISALVTAALIRRDHHDALYAATDAESDQLIGASKNSPTTYYMPRYVRATWVLHGLAMSLGIWVTVLFWLFVASFNFDNGNSPGLNILFHLSGMVLVLVDFSLAAFPWMLFQFVWSGVLAFVYMVWTAIHYGARLGNFYDSGNYLYPPVNWDYPAQTFFILLCALVVGIPLASIVVWALSSSAMGPCAARRVVPWVDMDGSGGHRVRSYKKKQVVQQHQVVAVAGAEADVSKPGGTTDV